MVHLSNNGVQSCAVGSGQDAEILLELFYGCFSFPLLFQPFLNGIPSAPLTSRTTAFVGRWVGSSCSSMVVHVSIGLTVFFGTERGFILRLLLEGKWATGRNNRRVYFVGWEEGEEAWVRKCSSCDWGWKVNELGNKREPHAYIVRGDWAEAPALCSTNVNVFPTSWRGLR